MKVHSPFSDLNQLLSEQILNNNLLLDLLLYEIVTAKMEAPGKQGDTIYDSANRENSFSVERGKSYLVKFYDHIELHSKAEINKTIYNLRSNSQIETYLTTVNRELKLKIAKAQKFNITGKEQAPFEQVIKRMITFKDEISALLLTNDNKPSKQIPKIQWLADINILATLFHDLLNGQSNGQGKAKTKSRPVIKVPKSSKIVLAKIICETFLDKNYNEIKEETILTYFKKPNKRAGYESRITVPPNI